MEDLVGVLIYLVLAIVGVIAGIYRNKHKRDQAAARIPGKTKPAEGIDTDYDPFSGLFEDEQEEEYQAAEQEEEYQAAEQEEEYKAAEQEEDYMAEEQEEDYMAEEQDHREQTYIVDEQKQTGYTGEDKRYDEGEPVFTETDEILVSDDIHESSENVISETEISSGIETDDHTEDVRKFDLKQAVIYSEIINRKEF